MWFVQSSLQQNLPIESAGISSCSPTMDTEGKCVRRVVKTGNRLLGAGYHNRKTLVSLLPGGVQNCIHGFKMIKGGKPWAARGMTQSLVPALLYTTSVTLGNIWPGLSPL